MRYSYQKIILYAIITNGEEKKYGRRPFLICQITFDGLLRLITVSREILILVNKFTRRVGR